MEKCESGQGEVFSSKNKVSRDNADQISPQSSSGISGSCEDGVFLVVFRQLVAAVVISVILLNQEQRGYQIVATAIYRTSLCLGDMMIYM